MVKLNERLLELRGARSEKGFSLIDLVVSVAIVIALSVGGFVSYGDLITQAKVGAVEYAANNVYRAALAAESDGDDGTSACKVIDTYNESQTGENGVTVQLIVPDSSDPTNETLYRYYPAAAGENPFVC